MPEPHVHDTIDVRVEDDEQRRHAHVSGALDVFSSPILASRTLAGLPDRTRELLIDLRDVSFVDSAGVSALVRLRQEAGARAVEVRASLGEATNTINATVVELLHRVLPIDD